MEGIFEKYRPYLETRPCELCGQREGFRQLPTREKYRFPVGVALCPQCGLLFFNPMWSAQGYDRFYEADYRRLSRPDHAPEARWADQQALGRWLCESALAGILKPTHRVLEIGCDCGGTLAAIRERVGCEVIGVEPNQAASAAARARGIPVKTRSFDGFEFEPESFDLILLAKTLNHMVHPVRAVQGVDRLLKRGGYFYTDLPDVVRGSSFRRVDAQIDHPFMYGASTGRLLLISNGFSIRKSWEFPRPHVMQIRLLAQKGAGPGAAGPEIRRSGRAVRRRMFWNTLKSPVTSFKQAWARRAGGN
ncbi:MAG: hypothetical protein COV76_04205 [Candidatus Omnitrophica bacterium CG11_big_fil_rev_8_21_14_0_20_64_10]|nr:MAG: hypothetical protein COV76_04205 [Candidatus Omnitrophica bacterium CG11_big_fil_rev_8_21_14_0_20_64_10]